MKLRCDDGNFVLDTIKEAKSANKLSKAWFTDEKDMVLHVISKINTQKIGFMGHSMGGATGIALARQRDDISAVIDLDGTPLTEVIRSEDGSYTINDTPYPVPALVLSQEIVYNTNEKQLLGAFADVTQSLTDHAKDGRLVTIKGAAHMDFTDLPLFSPALGSMLGHGSVNNEDCMNTVNHAALNWFNYFLKNEGTLDLQAQY